MNKEDFNRIIENRLDRINCTLASKNKEYGSNIDCLHNFKTAARILNCSPEKALLGMLMKHQVSVMDLINNIDNGITPSKQLINEKLGDNINYLILLEALLLERLTSIGEV